jgi:multidrug efflux system membrane fusion protein
MSVSAREIDRPDASTRRRARLSRQAGMVLLCLLVVAGIIYAAFFWHAGAPTKTTTAAEAVPVLAATSVAKDVPIYLDGLGTVQAYQTVTVRPVVDGPLIEVDFKEGQTVHEGDVLARIDPRPLQAALDQMVAKHKQDQATLANARVDLARYAKLAATAYTSAQQSDTQRALVAQLEAQVAGDQAQIDNARTQLGYTTIRAPLTGRAGIRLVDAGNIVHAADTTGIVMITQLQPISVIFTLPQQTLPDVRAAMQNGPAETLAVPQGADGAAMPVLDRGTLSVLDNSVDQTTGTIKLKATFPNVEERLWPGGFVGVRLRVRIDHDAVTVPPAAVQRGPSGSYVYVIGADNAVARRPVTVGHEDEQVTVLQSGLAPGERVVVDGASRLTDGSRVSIEQAPQAAQDGPVAAQAPGAASARQGAHPRGAAGAATP